MKKILLFISTVLMLTACSTKTVKQEEKTAETKTENTQTETIKVASHTEPMTSMLELVKPLLKEKGYDLEVVYVSDNVQANEALKEKSVDANFFQHKLFMEIFNEKNGTKFVAVQPIYDAVVSYYGKDLKTIEDLKDGSDVAIPNDPTNMTRALRLLASSNLITLKDPESFSVTVSDIVENPKNLKFTEVSLLNLNEAYQEKDMVFNYPAYASKIGLNPSDNGLLFEFGDEMPFAISIVVNEEDKDSNKIKALNEAMTSIEIQDFIEQNLQGFVRIAF